MKKIGNEVKLILFCLVIGAIAGIVFWLFLFAVHKGTWLLWDLVPENLLPFWWYPLLVCTAGGLLIGLFRKKFGDYPQDMMTVFGVVKKTKTYPYRKILIPAAMLLMVFVIGLFYLFRFTVKTTRGARRQLEGTIRGTIPFERPVFGRGRKNTRHLIGGASSTMAFSSVTSWKGLSDPSFSLPKSDAISLSRFK